MLLSDYQVASLETEQGSVDPADEVLIPLLGLSGEVGELLSEYKKHLRDGDAHRLFPARVEEELGDILWYIANLATKYSLDLDTIAAKNLIKCQSNWVREGAEELVASACGRFDSDYLEDERFPCQFSAVFCESEEAGRLKVRVSVDGKQMGEELTDNAYEDDGYRFHDVFHLACIAGLGWSPVSRRNLELKRRSDARTDEVEDGGRAIVIEEGVSALVFSYALDHNWLQGVERIDHDLLKLIKSMTAHLEVRECSIAEWEQTILRAYPVWREVYDNRGGTVHVDLDARTVSYEKGS